jgi:hypothetical protein
MKKSISIALISLSFALVGFRGSGRVGDDPDKAKYLKSTVLQSDVTVLIGEVYYQFAKETACSISGTRNIGHGPEEYITVQSVSWCTSSSVCD